MILNKGISLVFLSLSFSFLVSSCKLSNPFFIKNKKKEERKAKRAEKKEEKILKKDSTVVVKIDSLKILPYDTMLARNIIDSKITNYNTFQGKARMHFESGEDKQNFTANFRIAKDKMIWVTISGFGIEVARAIITPDSIKAIERVNKKAYLYSYSDLQKLINLEVDFSTLQSIIVGDAIATNGKIDDVKELGQITTIFLNGSDFTNQISLSKSDSTLKRIYLQTRRAVSNSSVLIEYKKYEQMMNKNFPVNRLFNIQDVKGAASLDMEVNKFEFDIPLEFPFSIPANYKLQN